MVQPLQVLDNALIEIRDIHLLYITVLFIFTNCTGCIQTYSEQMKIRIFDSVSNQNYHYHSKQQKYISSKVWHVILFPWNGITQAVIYSSWPGVFYCAKGQRAFSNFLRVSLNSDQSYSINQCVSLY